jgi:hypothetical protein
MIGLTLAGRHRLRPEPKRPPLVLGSDNVVSLPRNSAQVRGLAGVSSQARIGTRRGATAARRAQISARVSSLIQDMDYSQRSIQRRPASLAIFEDCESALSEDHERDQENYLDRLYRPSKPAARKAYPDKAARSRR